MKMTPRMLGKVPKDFDYRIYSRLYINGWKDNVTKKTVIRSYLRQGNKLKWPYRLDQCHILIYSGAKTGCNTLLTSFRNIKNDNTFHMHVEYTKDYYPLTKLINLKRENKLLIVSSYREPIARHISSYFHAIHKILHMKLNVVLNLDIRHIIDDFLNRITNNFINGHKERPYEAYHPHLENDRKNFDNVNIFDRAFNREEGFQIYETPNVKILMLRFDKINNWQNVIRENTEYKDFILIPDNLTKEKVTYDLYRKFCDEIIFPKNLLDVIYEYDKENMEYFYTKQEVENIKSKWYGRCT